MAITIAPITLSALGHLRTHGTSSLTAMRTSMPGLQSKTMGNLVQLGHALKTEAGYCITPKGRAKLASASAAANPPAARPAAPPAPTLPMLSNAEVEAAITNVLTRARVRISLQDIARRTHQAEHIVRPTLTTMIQQDKVEGTTGKPALYRLARTATRHVNQHMGSNPRDQLSSCHYTGAELLRNPGIPAERFAAFDLPSRMGNRLHYPDGRVERVVDPREEAAA